MTDLTKEYMSTADAVKLLNRSYQHVSKLVKDGVLEGVKLGRNYLISRKSVEAYMQSGTMRYLRAKDPEPTEPEPKPKRKSRAKKTTK